MEGVGSWVLNTPRGQAEFIGKDNYVPSVPGNLWKFLEGGTQAKFVDPQRRFVLLDALDEVLRGDSRSGRLRTVTVVKRQEDPGLRRSRFIIDPVPILIIEHGLVVFNSDGEVCWSHDSLKLDQFFQGVFKDRILYFSEHHGRWAYDLATGKEAPAD